MTRMAILFEHPNGTLLTMICTTKIFRTAFTSMGKRQAIIKYFFKDGEFWHKVTGAEVKITVPGYGQMFFEAGQLLFVDGELELIRGNNHNYVLDETDAICDYFRNQ